MAIRLVRKTGHLLVCLSDNGHLPSLQGEQPLIPANALDQIPSILWVPPHRVALGPIPAFHTHRIHKYQQVCFLTRPIKFYRPVAW